MMNMLYDLKNLFPSTNIALSDVVSFLSLFIAYLAYRSTHPRLYINAYIGSIVNSSNNFKKNDDRYLFISIANCGTRPIAITGLGGQYDSSLRLWLSHYFRWIKRKGGFIWSLQDTREFLFDEQGKVRILKDGEVISKPIKFILPKKGEKSSANPISKVRSLWVSDATNRYYKLEKRALKKLKKDIEDIYDETSK